MMNNKVNVANQKYQLLRTLIIIFVAFVVLAAMVLFTFRALDTRNYNGRVKEVSGIVLSVDLTDDDVEVLLSDNVKFNGNRIHTCYPEFDLSSLIGEQVTFYLPETQVGDNAPRWIIGIVKGNETLIDYNEVIANGKAEAKVAMIISGTITGVCGAVNIGLFLWIRRIGASKEETLYKAYAEFVAMRQPSCPEYKRLTTVTIIYLVAILLIVVLPISIVGATTENVTAQIGVAVGACAVFVGCTVGLIVWSNKLVQKEREYYAQNFPFDLDDISHLPAYGKQKKEKLQIQEQIREDRKKFPHRYYDAGNDFTLDFTEDGVVLFDEEDTSTPDTDYVFGDGEEKTSPRTICSFSYQELNFEALPYYRKKDHPLTVVVKSRITDTSSLPEEIVNDMHILLDSNLLATLRHFNVDVENLQNILDNKAQLIEQNCKGRKKENN